MKQEKYGKFERAAKLMMTSFLIISSLFLAKIESVSAYEEPNLLPPSEKIIEQAVYDVAKKKLRQAGAFVFGIQQKITISQDQLVRIQRNAKNLEERVEASKLKISDLSAQVENLQKLSLTTREKIQTVKIQIIETKNALSLLDAAIQEKEKIITTQVEKLNDWLVAVYIQTNAFFDPVEPNVLAFLARPESTGEIVKEHEYVSSLREGQKLLTKLIQEEKRDLEEQKLERQEKERTLRKLEELLEGEKRMLLEAEFALERLLAETKGNQAIYETLLEYSRRETEQVSVQIERLRENYAFFQQKLDEMKAASPAETVPENFAFSLNTEDVQLFINGRAPLAWPVSPAAGITAFFHDESYRAALGIVHNAIDIRVIQGTAVKAAEDGVVTKVIEGGLTYSYIIIAHPDQILTLYGHMSDILVNEGEIVKQGQTIGFSGGIPGTKGAGWLTTGAHLHFEVFENFAHVDPLDYLPLEYLPVASLPEKYLKTLYR